jgi:hypothetical protein
MCVIRRSQWEGTKVLRIGNAQGFWGDQLDAPATLIRQAPDMDYLTLDYLSEVSMSIMSIQQEKDSTTGYARDFVNVVQTLVPYWKQGLPFRVITNAGGLNPEACADACMDVLRKFGLRNKKIGIVSGDNILDQLKSDIENPLFRNLDTAESLSKVYKDLTTATAYLGAKPIVEALSRGANIVIAGRCADPSLTVSACAFHYGWRWDQFNELAGATIAGHLIECGTQVTGGISSNWLLLDRKAFIGFPIAEVEESGNCTITKPPATDGIVDEQTVKEQLLYEIEDPENYLSPDVIVSFLNLELEETGKDRIRITGAAGRNPSELLKISATYRDGFKAEGMLTIVGDEAELKARLCGEIVLQRIRHAGFDLEQTCVECLGSGDATLGVMGIRSDLKECVLRVCVKDHRREAVERFTKEIASLVASGPQGITGYTTGRPKVRPAFGFWPCLARKADVPATVKVVS